jgi:hypothetical protein
MILRHGGSDASAAFNAVGFRGPLIYPAILQRQSSYRDASRARGDSAGSRSHSAKARERLVDFYAGLIPPPVRCVWLL